MQLHACRGVQWLRHKLCRHVPNRSREGTLYRLLAGSCGQAKSESRVRTRAAPKCVGINALGHSEEVREEAGVIIRMYEDPDESLWNPATMLQRYWMRIDTRSPSFPGSSALVTDPGPDAPVVARLDSNPPGDSSYLPLVALAAVLRRPPVSPNLGSMPHCEEAAWSTNTRVIRRPCMVPCRHGWAATLAWTYEDLGNPFQCLIRNFSRGWPQKSPLKFRRVQGVENGPRGITVQARGRRQGSSAQAPASFPGSSPVRHGGMIGADI
ncbi:hypothetical protein B0H11DRAFT_698793 [Mycena galericulata]|nr:hypothetical protein B0H11DRAFT_698793 [Mycena galericulata]